MFSDTMSPTAKGDALYSSTQAKNIDQHAIENLGISGFSLMQAAGKNAWATARETYPELDYILVFCGPGNNGGDGWVFAQAARDSGCHVEVITPNNTGTPDAKRARQEACSVISMEHIHIIENQNPKTMIEQLAKNLEKTGQKSESVLIVDALFGIGLNKPPSGYYQQIIENLPLLKYPILALDVPSGINASSGQAPGVFVKANLTITFIVQKRGLYRDMGRLAAGKIQVDTLALPVIQPPRDLLGPSEVFQDNIEPDMFQFRPDYGHKGSFGTVLCVGGDRSMGGAIVIASESAARFGAGRVIIASHSQHTAIAVTRCPSLLTEDLDDQRHIHKQLEAVLKTVSCLILGPGLGQSEWSKACFKACLNSDFTGPIVLDADGLNLIASDDHIYALVRQCKSKLLVTPHPKEAKRLAGRLPHEYRSDDPFELASCISAHFNAVCLLKGHGTIITNAPSEHERTHAAEVQPEIRAFICSSGNAALAKAGQGDCLSGMLGALIAQGFDPLIAARFGAYAHGLAGDVWSMTESPLSLMPHDTAAIAARALNKHT